MSRVVAVSNRVGPVRDAAMAGGLAVALVDVLRDRGGLWFGWSGRVRDRRESAPTLQQTGKLTTATLDLSPAEYQGYYNDYSNRCLWPLCHSRVDLLRYDREAYRVYRGVNARFARALLPLLRPDDTLWVHDYHLIPLASELRALDVRNRIGFFLHVPFPSHDVLTSLPDYAWLVHALGAYDLAGFQTPADVERFRDCMLREIGGRSAGGALRPHGWTVEAAAFPIGIDARQFRTFAFTSLGEREFQRMREALRGRDQIIGVDRLDYSKGLVRRMSAFEWLLEHHSETHGRLNYLQVAPISRSELKPYREFRHELDRQAARVNGRYAMTDWMPVHYLNRAIPRRALAGLYRASRIGLVTPMRDGMNLVAKEYIAAQDSEDPGVLVLSRFAGAALQMDAALLVNPYDIAGVAEALLQAWAMSRDERCARHTRLMEGLLRDDASHWAETFLGALSASQALPALKLVAHS